MRGHVDPWRRVEAGSLSDYQQWATSDPSFAAAGADIVTALQAEGADPTRIDAAKSELGRAVEDMSQMGLQIADPVGAAKAYVLSGQTIAGAVSTVQGLSAAVQSGSPVEITQAFTGVMIGLAGAAGAVSAGTGALIVAGVGAVLGILQQQGLFGSNPGVQICQGVNASSQPNLVVGCLAGFTTSPVVPPGNPDWRTFPAKTKLDDLAWYQSCGNGGCGEFSWANVTWSNKLTANPPGPMRPIDWAFYAFQDGIEPYLTSPYGPPGFTDGWCAAWKSNAEYSLNGLKAQDDAMVLAHYVRLWNLAHTGSPVIPLSLVAAPNSYLRGLTKRARTYVQQPSDFYGADDLTINAGPMKAVSAPRVVHLSLASLVRSTAARAAAPRSSTETESVLAVGAIALGALMLWKPALLKKIGVRL